MNKTDLKKIDKEGAEGESDEHSDSGSEGEGDNGGGGLGNDEGTPGQDNGGKEQSLTELINSVETDQQRQQKLLDEKLSDLTDTQRKAALEAISQINSKANGKLDAHRGRKRSKKGGHLH